MSQESKESDVVRLVNRIIVDAIEARSSDIHIEIDEQGISLRFRIDGVLQPQPLSSEIRQVHQQIINRFKLLAELDIAERRLPQDGRFAMKIGETDVDVRMSSIPTLYGEGIVMRILNKGTASFSMRKLGMSPEVNEKFSEIIRLPHGLILITGPTGSGKTTTLYSALAAINKPGVKILTAEDPVEYRLPGASQIQINEKINLTFPTLLRRFLRHDPDVVFVGEIRDLETAEVTIQAAGTGHLVFSTMHTNDAAGAYARLLSQGVEPFFVSHCVDAVLAQRLVRNLCPQCKQAYSPKADELPAGFPKDTLLGADNAALQGILKRGAANGGQIFRAVGCPQCRKTGYQGRSGIYELLTPSSRILELVERRAKALDIKQTAVEEGMATLRMDGWRKVIAGDTSVEEILRVTKKD
ncbi:MAG: GspE/PulE family protein [Planctomycetaceae bacterium]|jgi:general secretion pathway protein E/type IV pilus assembly protein PilB|nr:GspE/PulE family protein [Planctomycetaceae bacterium]